VVRERREATMQVIINTDHNISLTENMIADIHCHLEAPPEGLSPELVTDKASMVDAAVSGALSKMTHMLETAFGCLDDQRKGGR
jgi:hypothetical protein